MTNIINPKEDISLILSGVRSLHGAIVPSLRSVSIELRNNQICWQCLYDETASDEELELLSAAAAEVIADFPDYTLEEIIKRVPRSLQMDHLRNLIYLRHE